MKRILLLFAFIISLKCAGQGSIEGDRAALVALYNSTDGPNWLRDDNWLNTPPLDNPCGFYWQGITCENGRVTGINLSNNNLKGPLPPEIGNLTELKTLIIRHERAYEFENTMAFVDGAIPAEIGNLTNLEYLDLAGNHFTGSIPASLQNLKKLKHLDLSYIASDPGFDPHGFLTGSIPPELGNLPELEYLAIVDQEITGITPALGNLTKLKHLDLVGNNISGTLPAQWGALINLEYLDLRFQSFLRQNQKGSLTGTIPSQFNALTKLAFLDLGNNSLSGPLPNLLGIPASAEVHLDGNDFTFAGMESNISRLDDYAPQSTVQLVVMVPLSAIDQSGPGGLMEMPVGGNMANNTFYWYKDDVLVYSGTGPNFSYYLPPHKGVYYVTATNSVATQLTLTSNKYTVIGFPVTLVSFSGKAEKERNKLQWKTTSETNNKGFEIEKSADAKTFSMIGFEDGYGDTNEDKNYSFVDKDPLDITYYRLKQIDHDGTFEYSSIVAVKNESAIAVYPNPAKDVVTIGGWPAGKSVIIFDQMGRKVLEQRRESTGKSIWVGNLVKGIYTIQIGTSKKQFVVAD